MKKFLLAAAGSLPLFLALSAGAQQAATPAPEIPKPTCNAPNMPGSKMMEEATVRRRFENDMKMYGTCMKAYVSERQAAAQSLQAQAKAQADAGNEAVKEYNARVKEMNDLAK